MNEKPFGISKKPRREFYELPAEEENPNEILEAVPDLSLSERTNLRALLLALGVAVVPMKEVNAPDELEPPYYAGLPVSKIVESRKKGDTFSS